MNFRGWLLLLFALMPLGVSAGDKKPNVLFVVFDDLRPDVGCYGDSIAITPNIDRLSSRSLLFERAYTQYPLCNPSRASVLSGRRPETLQIYDLAKNVRASDPAVVTLPQLFKNNGYQSLSFGKIFHTGSGNWNDLESWSEPPWDNDKYTTAGVVEQEKKQVVSDVKKTNAKRRAKRVPFDAPDVADDKLMDGKIARMAISAMRKNADRPFFLAVGFQKPHLPFTAPKKYWDMFDPAKIKLASNTGLPEGAPAYASNNAEEMRGYNGINKKGPIPEDKQRQLKHGYLAATAYADAQLGLVLDELDKLKLTDNTIIVLWSDHGYELGEHGTWCKLNNWEETARVPFMVHQPGMAAAGKRTQALVELVDLYPTLAEMAGLKAPDKLEGTSVVPLLSAPDKTWKKAAFTTLKRYRNRVELTGRAMATAQYRFVEWAKNGGTVDAVELYDHKTDPAENVNIAMKPENAELLKKLTEQLHAGWKAAVPAK